MAISTNPEPAVVRTSDGEGLDAEARAQLVQRLGRDASLAGDDRTVVARYWVSALDAGAADAVARDVLLDALLDLDGSGRWLIVRAHHAVASERAEEVYRGAARRVEGAAR